eukprot:Plantae.Rhodophyta-Rhodochaete_pulchella.ctg3243.p1 GENE.Plantae.Rhodophyta-Rhodochaete_pulchella.ctg3243~~Plantae.Rhodophyta-Rhodochaete_pulchella.ctg3243.p1  ORF type:complete len:1198 (-),score=285.09 Plantae.Rhodophyta-Rhodochaete_pulchella.ctg3243:1073-4666(-)
MYLEEVILDGFKSYSTRTCVTGFDRSFNAITGLNGSGKSNILDSICFVLGISNLSQVRAGSLQDLVYKQGQAGVTKATVTLVFNNAVSATSPVGYETCPQITVTRQIVIGGRNKYLINGTNAQPSRVQNLFHSVQLNVNNPHFLIMQGRITKVINMKPPELLAMVEEAAGTRMYEVKKEDALKTIRKKQRKVEEIDNLLEQDITPKLEKLRSDRGVYMQWASNKTEILRLEKFSVAYEYVSCEKLVERFQGDAGEMHAAIDKLEQDKASAMDSLRKCEQDVDELTKRRDREFGGGKIQSLEDKARKLSQEVLQKSEALKSEKDNLRSEREHLETTAKSLAAATEASEELKLGLGNVKAAAKNAQDDVEKYSREANAAMEAALTGASSGDNGNAVGSLAVDRLEIAKKEYSAAEGEIQRLNARKSHLEKELKTKSANLAKDRAKVDAIDTQKAKAEREIQKVELEIRELDFDSSRYERLEAQRKTETEALRSLREKHSQLSRRLAGFQFDYSDPEPNFNRRRVCGVVASLIEVKEKMFAKAVEVAAGGKLYHVVVDNDRTGKSLLEKGRLRRRVTILPLNKIEGKLVSQSAVHGAQRIEPQSRVALSLVGFDSEVSAAMKFVFGRTIVCPDLESARKVTFDPQVKCRTVTYDGDIVDPAGTLTGGSTAQSSEHPVLVQLLELKSIRGDLEMKERSLTKVAKELDAMHKKYESFKELSQTLELKTLDARLLTERLEQSEMGNLITEVARLRQEVTETIPRALEDAERIREDSKSKIETLENGMQNLAQAKQQAELEAQQHVAQSNERLANARSAHTELESRQELLTQRLAAVEQQIETLNNDKATSVQAIQALEDRAQAKEVELVELRKSSEDAQSAVLKEKQVLAHSDRELSAASQRRAEATRHMDSVDVEHKKISNKANNLARERNAAVASLERLTTKYSWIEREKIHFGKGDYDFEKQSPGQAQKKLVQLQESQAVLSKRVNSKAMAMFERAEQDYQDLVQKKKITEEDRKKIEKVIVELDLKKNIALEATWEKVNKDFSSIFSTLLPGANAKLEPPEGKTVLEGLEIRVAFGSVWKESLSELSGGQRSLIALSLILAMLLSKPAPMYILDEIDAALDLSHTQNIGIMLRTHFSNSQFIVVSLKEGMFNNANVIFRTKFVDGVSTVSRTVNRLHEGRGKRRADESDRDKENSIPDK